MKKRSRRNLTAGIHPWHALPIVEVLQQQQSFEKGLSSKEVERRLKEHGRNLLPVKAPPSALRVFLRQFLSPLIIVLLIAAVVSLFLGDRVDAGFIAFILTFNALIGTYQEYNAERSAAALQQLLKVTATVERDGSMQDIPAEEIVPGDIVLLESGVRVPADMRLLSEANLHIDESLLTGESTAQEKQEGPIEKNALINEQSNMAFAGSIVTTGRGRGVVVATGSGTQIGQIAATVTAGEQAEPPLVIRMKRFAREVTVAVMVVSVVIAGIEMSQGVAIEEVFFLMVALAVSAIPEGLPVAMTVALSVASRRMSRRNVIVRKLAAVESLGSCTLIASDKTGTLTVNQQTVKEIMLPGGSRFTISGVGYNDDGVVSTPEGDEMRYGDGQTMQSLHRLIEAVLLANEGTLAQTEEAEQGHQKSWQYRGDAMDVALLAVGLKYGIERDSLLDGKREHVIVPYESEKKHSGMFLKDASGVRVAMKGAVETVLEHCTDQLQDDGTLTALDKNTIEEEALALSKNGYRVLAVADGKSASLPQTENPAIEQTDLTFLGLVAFIDPMREEVPQAIQECRSAGVKVVMVTGDHPATAQSIGQQLGLISESESVVTGIDLDTLFEQNRKEFDRIVCSTTVFARVTPIQKLRIVESLIRGGHFVAVTGDGVNDAPALKTANIGVAMGSGTDVAKDTSSMIVIDDNFASIVAGIEEGRYAYDNVRKVIYLLVSTGVAELAIFVLATLFQTPIPLVAIQLLWLNVVTNGIQDIGLAFERGEESIMKRPPRRPKEGIFNRLMIEQTLVSGITMSIAAFATWMIVLGIGWSEEAARNMTLLVMVLMQNVHVLNCRSERESLFALPFFRNRVLLGGIVVAQLVHIIAMYTPFMQQLLDVQPISIWQWLTALCIALSLLSVMEGYKRIRRTWSVSEDSISPDPQPQAVTIRTQ